MESHIDDGLSQYWKLRDAAAEGWTSIDVISAVRGDVNSANLSTNQRPFSLPLASSCHIRLRYRFRK